jgi:hypothetical protein
MKLDINKSNGGRQRLSVTGIFKTHETRQNEVLRWVKMITQVGLVIKYMAELIKLFL